MVKMKKNIVSFIMVLAILFVIPDYSVVETKGTVNPSLNYSWITVPKDGTMTLSVSGTSGKVTWTSSNKKIATVSKKGIVTGKKNGKCTITAKVSGKKLKCQVTVKGQAKKPAKKAFTDVTLNVTSLKLDVHDVKYNASGAAVLSGKKGSYKLQVLNSSKSAKWTSSNKKVATVKKGVVTAAGAGECKITAKIKKKKYSCTVVVTDLNDAEKIAMQENIYEMLDYINQDRVKAKVAPLKIKEQVNRVADLRAGEITTQDTFNHTRPDGTSFKTAYSELGIKGGAVMGENLAFYADRTSNMAKFTKKAYDSLYNQKEHREMMLSSKYDYIGISYEKTQNYTNGAGALCVATYWAQEFYTK